MKKQNGKIDGVFVPHLISMLASPAWRILSLSARRILDRIEIERARHGGKDNGKLPVTFADLMKYGLDRHAIGPGVREVCALGFVENTRRGRSGNGGFRTPNLFRLTYLSAYGKAPTHEWREIETIAEAEKIASEARRPIKKHSREKQFPNGGKHTSQWGKPPLSPVGETPTTAPFPQWGKPPLLSRQSSHLDEGLGRGSELQPRPRRRS